MFKSFFCCGVRLRTKSITAFRIVCFSCEIENDGGSLGLIISLKTCSRLSPDSNKHNPKNQCQFTSLPTEHFDLILYVSQSQVAKVRRQMYENIIVSQISITVGGSRI